MSRRPSLTQTMATVTIIALVMGMMKAASEWLARPAVLGSIVGLLVATLGAMVRRRRRATWAGFALFGWGYLLVAAGGTFVADQHSAESDCDIWEVDGAIRALSDRFHPRPPQPVDPFPDNLIELDKATGVRTKLVNRTKVVMTPDEVKLQLRYEAQTAIFNAKSRAGRHSRAIGLACQGLAFALIGGAAGRFLSDRPANADATPGAETITLTG